MCYSSGSTFARPGGPSLQPFDPGDIVAGHSRGRAIPKVNPGAGFPPGLCVYIAHIPDLRDPHKSDPISTFRESSQLQPRNRAACLISVNPVRAGLPAWGLLFTSTARARQTGGDMQVSPTPSAIIRDLLPAGELRSVQIDGTASRSLRRGLPL